MDQLPLSVMAQMGMDPTDAMALDTDQEMDGSELPVKRSRRRNQLSQETPEKRSERLAKQRERGRRKRAEETQEQRAARLTKQRERIRQARALETPEKRAERLVRMREKGRQSRAMESATRREARLKAARDRAAQRRSEKKAAKAAARIEAAKARRREANRVRQSLKRAVETDEQLEERRTISRERQARRRSMETLEQREARLKKNRERQAMQRASETDEQREQRLKKNRERLARRRKDPSQTNGLEVDEEENVSVKTVSSSIQHASPMTSNGVCKCTHCGQTFPQQEDLSKHLSGDTCGGRGALGNVPTSSQTVEMEEEEKGSSYATNTPSRSPTPGPRPNQGSLPSAAPMAHSIAPLPELGLDDLSELEVQQTDDTLEELPVQPRNEMVLAHRQERESVSSQAVPLHVCGWCGHLFANPLDLSRHMQQSHSRGTMANKGHTYPQEDIDAPLPIPGERPKVTQAPQNVHSLGHEPHRNSSPRPHRTAPQKCAHPHCTKAFPNLSALWKHTLVSHKEDMHASLGALSSAGTHITGLYSNFHQAFLQQEGMEPLSTSSVMRLAIESSQGTNSPTCNLCGEIFSNLTTLLWHVQSELALEHVKQSSGSTRRSPSTEDTTPRSTNNPHHPHWSHGQSPVVPAGANPSSLSVSALVNQRQSGYHKPSYKCDRCDQLFHSPASMLYHVLDHTEKNLAGAEPGRRDGEGRGETRGVPGKSSQAYGGQIFSYVVP